MSLNMEGNMFAYSFDLDSESKDEALFKIKGQKLSNFCLLDQDTVAAISYANKTLTIFDTLS